MGKELRRAPRIAAELSVTVVPREAETNQVLGEPLMGRLNDISTYGARLTVPRIRSGQYHLFYGFNDDASRLITLEVIDPEEMEKLSIPMQPVWFDRLLDEPGQPFQLGCEFLVPPEHAAIVRLHALLLARQKEEGGWLKRLLRFA